MKAAPRCLALMHELRTRLDANYPEWAVGELSVAGTGLESAVFRADSAKLRRIALRVPWTRWISNDNDPSLDARSLLEKEELLANYMVEHGLPAPRAIARHAGEDDFDFLVSEFIINDGSAPDAYAFGRLMRRIHDLPAWEPPFRSQPSEPLEDTISERLLQRVAVVERLTGTRLHLPPRRALRDMLQQRNQRRSILHMDPRRENLLTWRQHIRGVIDWSNALLGDPALELARASEYGNVDQRFLDGYEETGPRMPTPREVELVYRLDSAVMLAVVFFSEAPDRERGARQLARVQELVRGLGQARARRKQPPVRQTNVDAASSAELGSVYASERWLAVQERGGRCPSRVLTLPDAAGSVRAMLPVYDRLPTRSRRYSIEHLLRGVARKDWPEEVTFGGLSSGYHTDIPCRAGDPADAVAELLDQAKARRPGSCLILPYATDDLVNQIVRTDASATVLFEAVDAWLLNPYGSAEALWESLPSRTRHVVRQDEQRFAASGLVSRGVGLFGNEQRFAELVSEHAARHGLVESAADLTLHLKIIAEVFGEDAVLLGAFRGERLVAGVLGLVHGQHLYMRMVGNEYSAVAGSGAHFILSMYDALRFCAQRRLEGVHLGLSVDRTKRSRGAQLKPLWTVLVGVRMPGVTELTEARLTEVAIDDPGTAAAMRALLGSSRAARS